MAPKKKQEKMALGEFLTNQSLGSWADEMDSQPIPSMPSYSSAGNRDRDGGGERRGFASSNWGEARSGSGRGGDGDSYDRPRFSDREQLPLPTKPPYTAHLGNLAYDVSQLDVETFLQDCHVTSVRIVEDKVDRKPKGFGYVEFSSLDGLKNALTRSESQFMGRNIKISIAEPPKDRQESSRDFSDWSRKGPLPDLPQNARQNSNRGFSRNFDNMSDAGSERGGSRRPAFFEADTKVRDFSNWERKGPLSPAPDAGPPIRDSGRVRDDGAPGERRQSPAWGEGRSDAGSRPPRREFEPRPPIERAPTAAEQDSQWRARMKPDVSPVPTPEASTPTSPAQAAPKERPRLNLTKRTVSSANPDEQGSTPSESKASPFGAAKPIDTAQRERDIEEKRELAVRQKKEADDKLKEDKAAQDAAARAARADRADHPQATEEDKVSSPTAGGQRPPRAERKPSRQQNGTKPAPKENGEAAPRPAEQRPSFSILRREEGEEGEEVTEPEGQETVKDAVDASANGTIVGDMETKPQEVVKEAPQDAAEGATQSADGTGEELEADGWSTVAAKTKSNRRGGARAIAS